ncbi:MAG: M15 family metallopeptidase [Desulfobacteraceae bacterium]|nr:M15 family metallopeptidase [Desulfobacteraceae bacterium]
MIFRKLHPGLLCALLILFSGYVSPVSGSALPEGFVYVDEAIPGIVVELRYYTDHNFVGERIDGYLKPRCILAREAAEALKGVQEDLARFGLGLKIYDAYRPQRAVDHFVRWAADLGDVRMKPEFYPNVDKSTLFDGYIAKKSGHTRGGTVDLTIVSTTGRDAPQDLDMGGPFDFFGPLSWPEYAEISPAQRAHRILLKTLMEKHGFKPYSKEWWHFTLIREPFPETYFNFPIQ